MATSADTRAAEPSSRAKPATTQAAAAKPAASGPQKALEKLDAGGGDDIGASLKTVGMALVFAAGLDILYQRLERVRVPAEAREEQPAAAAPASRPAGGAE